MSKEWDILHTSTMPVIALRGLTVFPNVLIHFEVSREASVRALEAAMTAGSPVFLVGQKDISVEEPELDDLYQVGTISNIRQILRMPGDNVRVMVEGQARGRLLQLLRTTPHLEAEVEEIEVPQVPARGSARTEALIQRGMDALMEGRTVFVIAHRLSTVRNSNCIVVIEHGEIEEKGSHQRLLEEKGRYYRLYTGQFQLS